MNTKILSAAKASAQRLLGLAITSTIFVALPLLTYWLPPDRLIIALVGFLSIINLAVMFYLNISAPSEYWRLAQIAFALTAIAMFVVITNHYEEIGVQFQWHR